MASIKVSRGNDLLFETCASKEGNITSLVSALRTVQESSNKYLSKLVEEGKSSDNNTKRQSHNDKMDDLEDNDSDDDADEKDNSYQNTKEMESGKRKNVLKTSSSKKSRSDH